MYVYWTNRFESIRSYVDKTKNALSTQVVIYTCSCINLFAAFTCLKLMAKSGGPPYSAVVS